MQKYQVLTGMHIGVGPDGREKTYRQGDIVETNLDLLKLNGDGMTPKFARVDGGTDVPSQSGPITVEEAARRGFDPGVSNTGKTSPPLPTSTTHMVPPQTQTPLSPRKPNASAPRNEAEYVDLLNSMSIKELQAHAAEEEIDVRGATKKEELIKIIKAVK